MKLEKVVHKTLELINCLMYLESAEVAHCYKQMLTSEMAFRVFFLFLFFKYLLRMPIPSSPEHMGT